MVVKFLVIIWRSALGVLLLLPLSAVALARPVSNLAHYGDISWLPGWQQARGIDALLWDSELRSIGMTPLQTQSITPILNDKFTASPFLPIPLWSSVNGQGTTALPAIRAASPEKGLSDATLPPEHEDALALRSIPEPRSLTAAPQSIHVLCDAQLPKLLQAGGSFWRSRAVNIAPSVLPPGELTKSPFPNPESLGDRAFAPSANRSNLPLPGREGTWCRPPPVLFVQSSPLATYKFWAPFILIGAAAAVLWMSRGVRMPRV